MPVPVRLRALAPRPGRATVEQQLGAPRRAEVTSPASPRFCGGRLSCPVEF